MNLTVFKNGGENYSFGRCFAGLVVAVGLAMMSLGIISDYNHPVNPVQITKFDITTKTSYTVTELVAKPDWGGYQSFMIGLATLSGAIYGMSKFGGAANVYAAGGSTNLPVAPPVSPPVQPAVKPKPLPKTDNEPVI